MPGQVWASPAANALMQVTRRLVQQLTRLGHVATSKARRWLPGSSPLVRLHAGTRSLSTEPCIQRTYIPTSRIERAARSCLSTAKSMSISVSPIWHEGGIVPTDGESLREARTEGRFK